MSEIKQQLEAIRERQRRATQGNWRAIENTASIPSVGVDYWLLAVMTPLNGGLDKKGAVPNAEYIAAACSPEGGDVTRLLAAVEVMAGGLEALSGLAGGGGPGTSLLSMAAGITAEDTLAIASAVLRGDL